LSSRLKILCVGVCLACLAPSADARVEQGCVRETVSTSVAALDPPLIEMEVSEIRARFPELYAHAPVPAKGLAHPEREAAMLEMLQDDPESYYRLAMQRSQSMTPATVKTLKDGVYEFVLIQPPMAGAALDLRIAPRNTGHFAIALGFPAYASGEIRVRAVAHSPWVDLDINTRSGNYRHSYESLRHVLDWILAERIPVRSLRLHGFENPF
jgi:hypothetical protein